MMRIGNYFVDKEEVTNINWLEFEYYIQNADSIDVEDIQPTEENFWFRQPSDRYTPIVCISKKQAEIYCKWRSKAVHDFHGKYYKFRLPTPEEWRKISTLLIKKEKKRINREFNRNTKNLSENPDLYTAFTTTESNHINHLFDNVSEMTSDPNIAMGGNNINIIPPRQATSQVIQYEKPSAYLGFRCIVEIKD